MQLRKNKSANTSWPNGSALAGIFLFAFIFLFSQDSIAQQDWSIKGAVVDYTSDSPLRFSTISVLRSKDSTLVKFARAAENGNFSISGLQNEKLFLLVTYLGYADYVEKFNLDSAKKEVDFGHIKLTLKANLLRDVVIEGKATPIRIKGDTTEFNASSYQIRPNSKVEDLLKQLPGIQIDKDGKITAQGKKVNKVLVDGEEFFGDDPTLVTKNIRGDMVSKVQLFDKKNDQAAFTGVDDSKKEKTINILLKEDMKNGYFGQLNLSGGNRKFYNTQAMINYFKRKQKFSGYGILSNTGKLSLGWEDNQKYGSADDIQFDEAGQGSIATDDVNGLDAQSGQYNGEGIPTVRSGGLHYDSKWNSDKESINANYKIGSFKVDGLKNTLSQNNLLSGIINSNSDQVFSNYTSRQKLDASYQIKLDSTSTLKVSLAGTENNTRIDQTFDSRSFSQELLLNKSLRTISNKGDNKAFNANVFLAKKLKKAGRTLSLNLKQSINDNQTDGFLKTNNEFFKTDGSRDSLQVIDQYKNNSIRSSAFSGNLSYKEPLSNSLSLVLSYGLGINNSKADRRSFNQSPDGKYNFLDTLYSNNYQLKQLVNVGGAIFNLKKGKALINFGTKVISMNFDQTDLLHKVAFKRNFINWNPQANLSYQIGQQKNIEIGYTGSTIQPTFDQIQPVRINTDPLNITIGNPNLRPSFNSGINIGYNSYRIMNEQNISVGGSYNFVSNPMVSSVITDAVGKNVYQSVNLRNKQTSNYNFYAGYQQKLKFIGINGGLDFRTSGNNYYSFINNTLNKMQSNIYSGSFSLSNFKENVYDARVSFGPTYTTNESSLQKQINDNGWGLNGYASFTIYLPGKFEIGSDARYERRAKTQSFNSDFNLLILNAQVSKKFLKSESLSFTLSANDILNQNTGFNRNANGNMITQTSFTTIRRYFIASLTWDFNKMGK